MTVAGGAAPESLFASPGAWLEAILDPAGRADDPAIISADGSKLTYGELADRVGGMGRNLRERGVEPGDRVVLSLPRCEALIVAMLAVLDIGATYVAVDPLYPEARRRQMIDDCQARTIIDSETVFSGTRAPASRRFDELAYISYTSGSSGKPKGVAIDLDALSAYLEWCHAELPRTGNGTPLLASSSFDHVVTCIYPPLIAGEPLKLLPEIGNGAWLGTDLVSRAPYSFVKITPSHLRFLTTEQRGLLGERSDLVMLGGEAPSDDLVRDLRAGAPDVRVMNHYGPTEATVGCVAFEVPPGYTSRPLPIGRPMPHVDSRTDDGELVVGGRCLAAGYWEDGRVRDTEPFFEDRDGKRWYRTGDRMRVDDEGELVYCGRVDRQVKILGHRIELAEVEQALRSLDSVDSAVVLKPDGASSLAALVTPAAGQSDADLAEGLGDRLVRAAIPGRIVRGDAIPVTVHGKTDLAAVESLVSGAADGGGGDRDIAMAVARHWREILDVEDVRPEDDFFQIGGDSLSVVELVDSLSELLDRDLDLSILFVNPTYGELVAAVAEKANEGS